jgi:hypothetical protein
MIYLTDSDVIAVLQTDMLLARVRKLFADEYARIDRAYMERDTRGPIDILRIELEAAMKIIDYVREDDSPSSIATYSSYLKAPNGKRAYVKAPNGMRAYVKAPNGKRPKG